LSKVIKAETDRYFKLDKKGKLWFEFSPVCS
jgi:hypothetical protein